MPEAVTANPDLIEEAAAAIHAHLSRRNIMQYLDNDEDCEGLARAAVAVALERAAGVAEEYAANSRSSSSAAMYQGVARSIRSLAGQ